MLVEDGAPEADTTTGVLGFGGGVLAGLYRYYIIHGTHVDASVALCDGHSILKAPLYLPFFCLWTHCKLYSS